MISVGGGIYGLVGDLSYRFKARRMDDFHKHYMVPLDAV
jgi:hypothetical protein